MTKQLLLAITLAGLVASASAQDAGQGQSIMFENQEQNRDYLTTLPESQKKKTRGDRCMEMSQEIERLKGKPQRRSTMMDRYRKECELP
jgi:TolA-binding protein